MNITIKEVEYPYVMQNIERILEFSTDAFLKNHKITQEAYLKTEERFRHTFKFLLQESTADMIDQIHKHKGLFFVAEMDNKIVAISLGYPYGKRGLSEEFMQTVFKSRCHFKDVMGGWWNLMEKYAGTPPGKVFHQAMMAIDPELAGQGIGAKICALTAQKINEKGYDGYAVETSSESTDMLAEKLSRQFKVHDIETSEAGLTFRLHLRPTGQSDAIHQWYLDKKRVQASNKEINVAEISTSGVHYHVGDIAVWDSNRESELPVVVMLHPNSACRLYFKNQMEDQNLTSSFRLIAIDLPGHGDSKWAEETKATYTFPGYAKAVAKVIKELGIKRCVLLGWSLGGHVALEAMRQIDGVAGVVISGTPPVELSMNGFSQVFKKIPTEMVKLMGKTNLTREEMTAFIMNVGNEKWMIEYGLKSDGRARKRLTQSINDGVGQDQRTLVAESKIPLAIIAGEQDSASPKDYLESLKFGNLWGMHFIDGIGHSLVYEKSERFNPILLTFLKENLK